MACVADGTILVPGQDGMPQVDATGHREGENVEPSALLQESAEGAQAGGARAAAENVDDDEEPTPPPEGSAEEAACEPEEDALDPNLVRQEALTICQARELAKACARRSGRRLAPAVDKAAERLARRLVRWAGSPPEPEPLTPEEAVALHGALQELSPVTAFPHAGEPTAEGVAAVERLAQQALAGVDLAAPCVVAPGVGPVPWPDAGGGGAGGGGGGEEGITVELLLRAGPERVRALNAALACLLRRTLAPSNVFGSLLLGRCVGCSELEEEASLAAVANFSAAVRADRGHFLMLDEVALMAVTANSQLQVAQELDVWQAIAEWVQHSWPTRRTLLYDLLRGGVRLSHLDTLQLSQLQRHPLLAGPEAGAAAALVSAAYSARILSNVHQSQRGQRPAAGASATGLGTGGGVGEFMGAGGVSQSSPRVKQEPSQQLQPQPQRSQPHAALQQLIGSLQARAAAVKARQQRQQNQQLLLQQQQQLHSHQQQYQQQQQQQQHQLQPQAHLHTRPAAPPSPFPDAAQPLHRDSGAGTHDPVSPRLGPGMVPHAGQGGGGGLFPTDAPAGGPSFGPGTAHGALGSGGTGPVPEPKGTGMAGSSAPPGAGGTSCSSPSSPSPLIQELGTGAGGGGGHAGAPGSTSPARSPSPLAALLPSHQQPGAVAGVGGGADKRQLASMLAQAIVKAAAKQGLPRIHVGEGGRVTPGAVQAALSAAQRQMQSIPQLQEMMREAKMHMAQAQQQQQQQAQQYQQQQPASPSQQQHQHQQQEQQQDVQQPDPQQQPQQPSGQSATHSHSPRPAPPQMRPPLLTVPAADGSSPSPKPGLAASGPAGSPSPISLPLLPSPLALSPGTLTSPLPGSSTPSSSTSAAATQPGGQQQQQHPAGPQEGGRPQQVLALAPQQLLQIAAAVQRAAQSGHPQPPHVRQQLQQLQAFISRQLAASPAGAPQQPLLLALQCMLAGVGQPQGQQGQGQQSQQQGQPQTQAPVQDPPQPQQGPPDPSGTQPPPDTQQRPQQAEQQAEQQAAEHRVRAEESQQGGGGAAGMGEGAVGSAGEGVDRASPDAAAAGARREGSPALAQPQPQPGGARSPGRDSGEEPEAKRQRVD